MRNEVKKTIRGNEYTFYQFPATEGVKVLMRLSKLIGEPLGLLGATVLNKGGIKEVMGSNADVAIGKAVKALVDNIQVDETFDLIQTFFRQVHFKGQALADIFDAHFQGQYALIIDIVKAAIEVQYGNFFKELVGMSGSSQTGSEPAK